MILTQLLRCIAAAGGLLLLTLADSTRAQTWIQTSAPITNWTAIAGSADGTRLVAAVDGGPIYRSLDSGASWTATGAPGTNWIAVACSADGAKIVAAVAIFAGSQYTGGGPIYISTDSGASWTATRAPLTNWTAVVASADGSHFAAAAGGRVIYVTSAPPGPIYRSMDSGATWVEADAPNADWTSMAASADGMKLAATVYTGGGASLLYTSTNAGITWAPTNTGLPYLVSVASSADGRRLVAGTFDPFHPPGTGGAFAVFRYTNAEAWSLALAGGLGRGLVASSADGTRLLAAGGPNGFGRGGALFSSLDSGATWTEAHVPSTNWSSLAVSADGGKFVAVVRGGGIWTAQSAVMPKLNLVPSGNHVLLSWTVPSEEFVLQENTDLNTTNWIRSATNPVLNTANLQNDVRLLRSLGGRFYRLQH